MIALLTIKNIILDKLIKIKISYQNNFKTLNILGIIYYYQTLNYKNSKIIEL